MKKNIEVWPSNDAQGNWMLCIKKARGKLTLEEIIQGDHTGREGVGRGLLHDAAQVH